MHKIVKRTITAILSLSMTGTILSLTAAATAPGELYVSPQGSDQNPGTKDAPLRTIEKARDTVRGMNSDMDADINIYLREGTYTVPESIVFESQDSGSNGFHINYQNYPGETPTISGGKTITDFELYDAANNIYKAEHVDFPFRQLYVNGQKAVRARTPNLLETPDEYGAFNFDNTLSTDYTTATVGIPLSQIENVAPERLQKVELKIILEWAMNAMRIKSYTADGDKAILSFQDEEANIARVRRWPWLNGTVHYYMENAYEYIDADQEWFWDENTNTLYYKAPAGMDMRSAQVIAPYTETLINIAGTKEAPVHHITFSGITFEHSTYLRPNTHGYMEAQAAQYQHYMILEEGETLTDRKTTGHPASAVYAVWADHLVFERNTFQNLGATGLDLHYGTHDNRVNGNIFTEIAGNGISTGRFSEHLTGENELYSPDPDAVSNPQNLADMDSVNHDEQITNNYITNTCTEFNGGVAIAIGYARNMLIEHNEIYDQPYTGISMGWGWTHKDNVMSNNVIRYNNIHKIGQYVLDGGAIYTLSKQPNSICANNLINDNQRRYVGWPLSALYFDQGTMGYSIYDNVRVNAAGIQFNTNYAGWSPDWNDYDENETYLDETIYHAGIEPGYFNIHLPHTILPLSTEAAAGSAVRIKPICAPACTVWLAPEGTSVFEENSRITKTTGDSEYITAPSLSGNYKVYVTDSLGQVSPASANTLTVYGSEPPVNLYHADENGLCASDILPGGTVQARTYVSNETDTDREVTLIAANFSSDGSVLKKVELTPAAIPPGAHNQCITANIDISGTDDCVKAFLWDGLSVMQPLGDNVSKSSVCAPPVENQSSIEQYCYAPCDSALKLWGDSISLEQKITNTSDAPVTYKTSVWFKTAKPAQSSVTAAYSNGNGWEVEKAAISSSSWTKVTKYITVAAGNELIFKPVDNTSAFSDYPLYVANASVVSLNPDGSENEDNLLAPDSFTNPSAWNGIAGNRLLLPTDHADLNFYRNGELLCGSQPITAGASVTIKTLACELNPLEGTVSWRCEAAGDAAAAQMTQFLNSPFQDLTITGNVQGETTVSVTYAINENPVAENTFVCETTEQVYQLRLQDTTVIDGRSLIEGTGKIQVIDTTTGQIVTNDKLSWSVSDPALSEVSEGIVTIKFGKEGPLTVTASSNDGQSSGSIDVLAISASLGIITSKTVDTVPAKKAAKLQSNKPIGFEKSIDTVEPGLYKVSMWFKTYLPLNPSTSVCLYANGEWGESENVSLRSGAWTNAIIYCQITKAGKVTVKPVNNVPGFYEYPIYLANTTFTKVGGDGANLLENGDFTQGLDDWGGGSEAEILNTDSIDGIMLSCYDKQIMTAGDLPVKVKAQPLEINPVTPGTWEWSLTGTGAQISQISEDTAMITPQEEGDAVITIRYKNGDEILSQKEMHLHILASTELSRITQTQDESIVLPINDTELNFAGLTPEIGENGELLSWNTPDKGYGPDKYVYWNVDIKTAGNYHVTAENCGDSTTALRMTAHADNHMTAVIPSTAWAFKPYHMGMIYLPAGQYAIKLEKSNESWGGQIKALTLTKADEEKCSNIALAAQQPNGTATLFAGSSNDARPYIINGYEEDWRIVLKSGGAAMWKINLTKPEKFKIHFTNLSSEGNSHYTIHVFDETMKEKLQPVLSGQFTGGGEWAGHGFDAGILDMSNLETGTYYILVSHDSSLSGIMNQSGGGIQLLPQ